MNRDGIPNALHHPVTKPAGYTQGEIECIDAQRSCLTAEEYRGSCKAQALQYIWRERHKGGDEDLKKAIWWLRMALGDDPRTDRNPVYKDPYDWTENTFGFTPK